MIVAVIRTIHLNSEQEFFMIALLKDYAGFVMQTIIKDMDTGDNLLLLEKWLEFERELEYEEE